MRVQLEMSSTTKSVFSQLRTLAKDVDKGVASLEKDIVEESISSERCEKNVAIAKREIRNLLKETKQMKEKANTTQDDFVIRSSSFNQICDLFKDVLQNQQSRLHNVETYMSQYGFVKQAEPPVSSSDEIASPDLVKEENLQEKEQPTASEEPEVEEPDVAAEPKFPYSSLSEDTMMLFKEGLKSQRTPHKVASSGSTKYSSQKKVLEPILNNVPKISTNTKAKLFSTPEIPPMLETYLPHKNRSKFFDTPNVETPELTSANKDYNNKISQYNGIKQELTSTLLQDFPEPPTLHTQDLSGYKFLTSSSSSYTENPQPPPSLSETSTTSCPTAPPLPQLLTQRCAEGMLPPAAAASSHLHDESRMMSPSKSPPEVKTNTTTSSLNSLDFFSPPPPPTLLGQYSYLKD